MLARILTIFVIIFLLLPVLIVIPISFSSAQYLTFPPPGFSLKWYEKFLSDPEWISAFFKSLEIGVLTTIFSLVFGITAAIGLSKSNSKARKIFQELFQLPQIMPVIIVAIAVYGFQSQLKLIGSTFGLVTAHTILATPIVITTVMASICNLDPNLENAAVILGANRIQAFFRVIIHSIKPSIISAALFAFVTSFDEIVVTLFISGVSVTTLPKKMWDGIRTQIEPTIAAVSSLLIFIVIIVMLISAFTSKDNSKSKPKETVL